MEIKYIKINEMQLINVVFKEKFIAQNTYIRK